MSTSLLKSLRSYTSNQWSSNQKTKGGTKATELAPTKKKRPCRAARNLCIPHLPKLSGRAHRRKALLPQVYRVDDIAIKGKVRLPSLLLFFRELYAPIKTSPPPAHRPCESARNPFYEPSALKVHNYDPVRSKTKSICDDMVHGLKQKR